MVRRFIATAVALVIVAGLLVWAWGPGTAARNTNPSDAAAGQPGTTQPDNASMALPADAKAKAAESLAKGAKFLLGGQQPDGSWGGKFGPAMTALAVKALVDQGQAVDSPPIKKALDFIVAGQHKATPGSDEAKDPLVGAFADQALANYNTAICLSTLAMANAKLPGKPYDAAIKAGLGFLRRDQWGGEGRPLDKKNPAYGGFGYGNGERPDMSNTNTTMDALKELQDAGYVNKDDPMYAKVQVFLQRSQNRSESNDAGSFEVSDDGGFIYTPAQSPKQGGPESKAGATKMPDAKSKLTSYGSMTYAGFKSYVYSGLPADDPRVKDAFAWIRKNYTFNENPGVGPEGLFYYYHTAARALNASGEAIIKDAANVPHDWRAEMIAKLASLQRADGSWVNEKASRWEEGNPILATSFAMLAMEEATSGHLATK